MKEEAKAKEEIVVRTETGREFRFNPTIIEDENMMNPLIKDTARFFKMGEVKGREFALLYPIEENDDKIGIFAKTAKEMARLAIMARAHADKNTKNSIDEVFPVLQYIEEFNDAEIRTTMLALNFMGHHEDMIFFLFLHMLPEEAWP